jgi:hypothetical protein
MPDDRLDIVLLLDALRPKFSKNGHQVQFFSEVAKRLSRIARQDPPWSWRYVQSAYSDTLGHPPSKRFLRAVELLASEVDGMPAFIADTEAVTVYARPGAIRPGTIILGVSQLCKHPPCGIWFVRTHPRQKYCPHHRDPKNRL